MLAALAGRRHIESATPDLFKLADDADANERSAALAALGSTIAVGDLPVLIARAVDPGKPDEAQVALVALRIACGRMPDRDAATAHLVKALGTVQVPAKCKLIDVLVPLGGDKALKVVADAAKDANGDVRRAAYKALGQWTSTGAGPVLLDLVKRGDPELKIGATRAYNRIARQFSIPNDRRMAMFREIMALAQRDDERRLALDILKQIRTAEALSVAVGYLDQPALGDAAARVAVTMSGKMVDPADAEAVAAAMRRVLRTTKDKEVINKAREMLNRAGKK